MLATPRRQRTIEHAQNSKGNQGELERNSKKWKFNRPSKHYEQYPAFSPGSQTSMKKLKIHKKSYQQILINDDGSSQYEKSSLQNRVKQSNKNQISKQINKINEIINMIKKSKKMSFNFSHHNDTQSKKYILPTYLDRNIINKKNQTIGEELIEQYRESSPTDMLKVKQNNRRFLMQKMVKDFKSYNEVSKYQEEQIRQRINTELNKRKKDNHLEYLKRKSSPYLSYLSLQKHQRQIVKNRQKPYVSANLDSQLNKSSAQSSRYHKFLTES